MRKGLFGDELNPERVLQTSVGSKKLWESLGQILNFPDHPFPGIFKLFQNDRRSAGIRLGIVETMCAAHTWTMTFLGLLHSLWKDQA
jgi:hypothetical protein